jgi:hypothetical protein
MTVKHNVWSLLADREVLSSVSDAVIVKATGKDAVKVETTYARQQAEALLSDVETPEDFGVALQTFVQTYGSADELARMSTLTRQASAIVAAGIKVFVVKAYESGWVGRGKAYTNGSLAKACGVSPARISQLTPDRFKDASKRNTPRGAGAGRDGVVTPEGGTDAAPEGDAPTSKPMDALQQALTRLESASSKAFGPEDFADVLRVANALDVVAKNLRLIAKPSAAVA